MPYGVKAITKTHKGENVGNIISVSTKNNIILGELYNGEECFWLDYGSFKPYLRPMSSMSSKEKMELRQWGSLCMTEKDVVEEFVFRYVELKNKRLHIYNEKSYYRGKDEKELIKKYGESSYINSLDEYMF